MLPQCYDAHLPDQCHTLPGAAQAAFRSRFNEERGEQKRQQAALQTSLLARARTERADAKEAYGRQLSSRLETLRHEHRRDSFRAEEAQRLRHTEALNQTRLHHERSLEKLRRDNASGEAALRQALHDHACKVSSLSTEHDKLLAAHAQMEAQYKQLHMEHQEHHQVKMKVEARAAELEKKVALALQRQQAAVANNERQLRLERGRIQAAVAEGESIRMEHEAEHRAAASYRQRYKAKQQLLREELESQLEAFCHTAGAAGRGAGGLDEMRGNRGRSEAQAKGQMGRSV